MACVVDNGKCVFFVWEGDAAIGVMHGVTGTLSTKTQLGNIMSTSSRGVTLALSMTAAARTLLRAVPVLPPL